MSISFLTSLSDEDFKNYLKDAIREVLHEEHHAEPAPSAPLGIAEAAALLKLKITTLYEKTSKKLIPHFKRGNKLYFNRADLEDWIKRGKVTTNAEIEGRAATYLLNGKNHKGRKNK